MPNPVGKVTDSGIVPTRNGKRKYHTVTYICRCGWQTTVRVAVPKGKEHHALSYRQAVGPEHCLRCVVRAQLENCICGSCQHLGLVKEAAHA